MALWHQTLAHISCRKIFTMASQNLVEGLVIPTDGVTPAEPCIGCLSGKMHRLPFPIRRTRANQIGGLIHSDVCGPMQVPTPDILFYLLTIIAHGELYTLFRKNQKFQNVSNHTFDNFMGKQATLSGPLEQTMVENTSVILHSTNGCLRKEFVMNRQSPTHLNRKGKIALFWKGAGAFCTPIIFLWNYGPKPYHVRNMF